MAELKRIAELGYTSLLCKGKLLEFRASSNLRQIPPTSKRGVVHGFSSASRLRMLKFFATIDWKTIGSTLFVTLTYPDGLCNRGNKQRNQDRMLFWRYLETHIGRQVAGIWRCEWKPRKSGENKGWVVPHYHFLIFGVDFIHHTLIRSWWRKITHAVGPLATDIRKISDGEKDGLYVAKYIGKETTRASLDYAAYLNNGGRHYGFKRKKLIPTFPGTFIFGVEEVEANWLNSFASQFLGSVTDGLNQSFTLLGRLAVDAEIGLKKLRLTSSGAL